MSLLKLSHDQASYKEYAEKLEAAISDERSARESLKSKRQEIDSVQSRINMMKNAISVEDIDGSVSSFFRSFFFSFHLLEAFSGDCSFRRLSDLFRSIL